MTQQPYQASDKVKVQIEKSFVYHSPKNDQSERYVELRDTGKKFAELIAAYVPESREQSLALTKLEEVIMWANAGIARNE